MYVRMLGIKVCSRYYGGAKITLLISESHNCTSISLERNESDGVQAARALLAVRSHFATCDADMNYTIMFSRAINSDMIMSILSFEHVYSVH